jgi:two-component system phosphate regulon response regulator OmpR
MPLATAPISPALRPHVLVVDDDDRLRSLLHRYLTEHGMVVTTAASAAEARGLLPSLSYDLMVLDIMMPQESGLDFAKSLREKGGAVAKSLPILLLTARGDSDDRIKGLEAGADDYLPKPFEPRELLLRIEAILRRAPKPALPQTTELKLGRWLYRPERDELSSDDEVLRLTDMEAGLMRTLAREPGAVVSREALAAESKGEINDRTIDVQVTRLRRKIEEDPKNPRYLITVRGEGYMLLPEIV